MELEITTIWWLLVISLFGIEMLTGTFYLLVIIPGFVCGAILAHLDFELSTQISVNATVSILGLIILKLNKKKIKSELFTENVDNLDINNIIYINSWEENKKVSYRGSFWSVVLKEDNKINKTINGNYKIIGIQNNKLVIEKI